jgi:PAS domain S-box-containing protein
VEASRDAIWRWTLDGAITSWNGEAERMMGYRADEIVGKPLMTLIPADRMKTAQDVISKLRQGQAYGPLETVRIHKNGTPVCVELTVSPIRDVEGRISAAATICRDITERKQAEAAISADLQDMARLNELSNRLVRKADDFAENLNSVVDTAVGITGSVKASLRLVDSANRILKLVAHRGFENTYYFNLFEAMPLDASAYAAVIRNGERLIIEDMRESELF